MRLDFDADAVRGLARDTRRLADGLVTEAQGAEASLLDASTSAAQDDVTTAVDELLQTLRTAHAGVIRGLRGFGAELEMAAGAVEDTDRRLASKVPGQA